MRTHLTAVLAHACAVIVFSMAGCSRANSAPPPQAAQRAFRMGFAPTPPVMTTQSVLDGIDIWSPRADITILHEELPWTDLLNGMSAADILTRDKVQLVALLRQQGLQLVFMADLTDGLSRAEEAPQLRALSRSLAEPAVQQLARDYVLAVAAMLQPEYLGLAAETNLIRAAAPSTVYDAVVTTANAMASDLAAAHVDTTLFISVQVETAWGLFSNSGYQGIDQDLQDFAFAQALGLSSYPYFVWPTPAAIPDDYYLRLANVTPLPLLVVEGGWSSAAVTGFASSPELQARYLERQSVLLDGVGAVAWLQLLFADPDLAQWPQPQPANLPLFTSIGLCNSDFTPKPALAVWDQQFARPLLR